MPPQRTTIWRSHAIGLVAIWFALGTAIICSVAQGQAPMLAAGMAERGPPALIGVVPPAVRGGAAQTATPPMQNRPARNARAPAVQQPPPLSSADGPSRGPVNRGRVSAAAPPPVATGRLAPTNLASQPPAPAAGARTANPELLPSPAGTAPGDKLESRLRELEQQFDEQRFQLEVVQQQLNDERAAREAAARQAAQAAAAQTQAAKQGYVVGSDPSMRATWMNGLTFESPNKDFWFHIGGRTQLDGVWLQAPNNALNGAGGVGASDAVDFRRARLRAEGTMYDVVDWCVEYNFVGTVNLSPGTPATPGTIATTPQPTDLWWNFRRVPVLNNLTIGNIKEPFGLERLESSRFLDFMERSYNQDAFMAPSNNGFAPGILTWNYGESRRWTYAAGVFKNTEFTPFVFGVGNGDYAADGRVTIAPYYDEASNGRYLVHLGLGGSWRENQDGQIRFRSRGALRNGPDALNPILADTGVYRSHAEGILVPEAAIVWGPWLFQAEYAATWATQSVTTANVPVGTTFYSGYYVEALYFLTGEHRIYDYQKGLFGRVIPFENASFVRGARGRPLFFSGAWQLGVRYNALNLDSKTINGGQLHNITLGLNWFLNPNMKLQWNVILTHRDGQNNTADGNIYGFGMRVAHDF